jgi:anti-sigma regulatory factor (Ser/Thr protein kinase)
MTLTRKFPSEPNAVTAARRFVREALSDQATDVKQAAELMATELATNCVLHAQTGFELSIDTAPAIRIEVRDSGDGEPTVLSPPVSQRTGRGLQIVEAMSQAWGVTQLPSGKAVWFTVERRDARDGAPAGAPAR